MFGCKVKIAETGAAALLVKSLEEGRLEKTVLTLVLIHRPPKFLLGLKKRGFGAGYYNLTGGHVEKNETIEQNAVRETQAECHLTPKGVREIGVLHFLFLDRPDEVREAHVLKALDYAGILRGSREMGVFAWRDENMKDVPLDKMWPADRFWLPFALKGHPFSGIFVYKGLNDHALVLQRMPVSYFPMCPKCRRSDCVKMNDELPALGQLMISKPIFDFFCWRCQEGFYKQNEKH